MSEQAIIRKYLDINDYIAVYHPGSAPTEGYVREIDEHFLHLEVENGVRLFRLCLLSSFSVVKKYDPNENEIDRKAEHTGIISSYSSQKQAGTISEIMEGNLQKCYFFHFNHIGPSQTELRNLLLTNTWSGTAVHFHLSLNHKGPCAKEISLIRRTALEYSEKQQSAQIQYYSNSGKHGTLYIEEKKALLPFHLFQVSSEALADALLKGRWRGKRVQFFFAYNAALLCADDIREEKTSPLFDGSLYRHGSVVECISSGKSSLLQIMDDNGNSFTARQQDIADLRLFTLARERWNFNAHPCGIFFLSSDANASYAKHVILDDELEESVRVQIEQDQLQWQYNSLPREPVSLDQLPAEMVESAVFHRVKTMNENGNEDEAFDLLEQYKDKLDPVKKQNWEITLAAHSKRHDEKLFELLKEDDEQTIVSDEKLTDSQKSTRATHLEILRDAYFRQGDMKRVQDLRQRIDILRFFENTGLQKRCSAELITAEQNLKKLLCEIMPRIWTAMYPDGKGDRRLSDWETGYLYDPPKDYDKIYLQRKKYKDWIRNRHKKGKEVTLQAVLSLKDVVYLIQHYASPAWYQNWRMMEQQTSMMKKTDDFVVPCFCDIFGEEWTSLNQCLCIIARERDQYSHTDARSNPALLLENSRQSLDSAKQINSFFMKIARER